MGTKELSGCNGDILFFHRDRSGFYQTGGMTPGAGANVVTCGRGHRAQREGGQAGRRTSEFLHSRPGVASAQPCPV